MDNQKGLVLVVAKTAAFQKAISSCRIYEFELPLGIYAREVQHRPDPIAVAGAILTFAHADTREKKDQFASDQLDTG